jgi:DNA-3-methyladenine glycosylase
VGDLDFWHQDVVEIAPLLLNARLTRKSPDGTTTVRLTEVEAYRGVGQDPGSHSHRGQTPRTAVMFGAPHHLYVYFSYGMHVCANIVCGPEGTAGGVLLRGGEIVIGGDIATARRGITVPARDLARGPARLSKAMGIVLSDNGSDLAREPFSFHRAADPVDYVSGPRTGVSGDGGLDRYPWRFWIAGDETVSPYRRSPRISQQG